MNTPTPTPRTKEIWGAMLFTYPFLINCVNETGEMEAELTAAREEITLLKTNLKIQTNHTENAVQDRADEHIELHNQIQELTEQRDSYKDRFESLLKQYAIETHQLTEQRDRLDDQLDLILLRLGITQERMIDAERQRDKLVKLLEPFKYWRDITECDCSNPLPHGGCLRCDLDKILNLNEPTEP